MFETSTAVPTDGSFPENELKVAIYGGCVSRDAVEDSPRSDLKVSRYIARHSLLSAGTDASGNVEEFKLDSKFQQRMLEFDIRGELDSMLRSFSQADVLLWDLNSERSGVFEFEDASTVTRSPELKRATNGFKSLARKRYIQFASDEHLARWKAAANIVIGLMKTNNIWQKTLVIAADWAEYDEQGNRTGKLGGRSASWYNQKFRPYYSHLEKCGLSVARFKTVVADSQHKWGRGPFHYSDTTYREINSRIEEFISASAKHT